MTIELPILITFVGYLVLTMLIGVVAYKATSSLSDYILGGRRLGPSVAALSVGASDMSGWLLLGLPGAVYLHGLNQAWIGIGLVVGAWLNWLFVAKRLRVYTEQANDSLTLPDFLENRLDDRSGLIRVISALTILVFFVFYTSSGLVGGAILFEQVFGLPYLTALLVGGSVIVAYTFMGGFLAVSWTDFFQGILMLIALIAMPWAVMNELGGMEQTMTTLTAMDAHKLELFHDFSLFGGLSLMAWGLGYFGQPHILARFMAIDSPRSVPLSRRIAMSWMVLSLIGALGVGLAGAVYFADAPLANPETVFLALSNAVFNPWVAGLLIAAIMSAIMSTIDSQLLVCSSALTEDFYKRWLRPHASDNELVWVGRFAVLAVAVAAMLIALDPQTTVLGLVSYAWAGFGAAFGPVIILSVFWPRLTRNGALAGIVLGALTVIGWKQLEGGLFDLYEIVPGFIICALACILVSRKDKEPSKSVTLAFRRMESEL
ncbi:MULTISPECIES: sodium/proline symporter PutP [Oceanimonas]|uniref:Sodium/proline symporter n=1 Tax=Oceanimonas doudoroffii TaxID=84158 RepID=A0A233RFD9_9GAMM|nr:MULTISPECIES: sodium/proline symporter PutP [Oceanimonas]NHI01605.1 Sodium/proline symporter [Oceanimonas sp. MB9]OXY82096.1 sodium/proline symporter [Oceanimonas doudoroffii]